MHAATHHDRSDDIVRQTPPALPPFRKAVVVRNGPHFHELIRIALGSFGVTEIVEAHDGDEVLEVLHSFPADMVIMDWRMGGKGYLACARGIRSAGNDLAARSPIVVVSGYGCDDTSSTAQAAGVDVYLDRPLSIKPLYAGFLRAVGGVAGTA